MGSGLGGADLQRGEIDSSPCLPGLGQGAARSLVLLSGLPRAAGSQQGPSSAFPGHGTEWKVERPEMEPVVIEDAGIANRGLACHDTTLAWPESSENDQMISTLGFMGSVVSISDSSSVLSCESGDAMRECSCSPARDLPKPGGRLGWALGCGFPTSPASWPGTQLCLHSTCFPFVAPFCSPGM